MQDGELPRSIIRPLKMLYGIYVPTHLTNIKTCKKCTNNIYLNYDGGGDPVFLSMLFLLLLRLNYHLCARRSAAQSDRSNPLRVIGSLGAV